MTQERLVVGGELALQLLHLGGELAVRGQDLPESHEGPDHLDAHLDGLGRAQDGCGHDGAVLCEGGGRLPTCSPIRS